MTAHLPTPTSGLRHGLQSAIAALTPAPRLRVWEWADQARYLPTKGSGEPGPWRTDRVPFAREIMDCLSDDHPCQRVVLSNRARSAARKSA